MEKAAQAAEIPARSMKGFTMKGRKILIANVGGSFHAMGAVCYPMQGDLTMGNLDGKIVTRTVHHSRFDVTTGKVVGNVSWAVKTFTRKSATDLATFRTEVKDGAVFVEV
ncbi:MAG TPA: Rieske 2Fe-2S domain-containing protein [Methanomicrobiales archaeon]|jgi:nitrite reductase/ring-hydroxylating ferredoxin subunit|nr:Rieske 2Fe-2S domain-containing protein [Methanomicrobiales archaeon]